MDTIEWLRKRWEALGDVSEQLQVLTEDITPEAYFQKYIENAESDVADKRLKVFENLKKVDKEKQLELKLDKIRIDRNQLLADSDKTMLADYPIDSEAKKHWRKYRQYLRDFPANYADHRLDHDYPMSFELWGNWIESVRHKAGFEGFIP